MLKYMFFSLICLPLHLLMGSIIQEAESNISYDLTPCWVKECDFPRHPIPLKPSEINLQCLLIDLQMNWEEKTSYHHFAVKPLTHLGISDVAQVEIDFDPTFEKVIVHDIHVLRDGKTLDRLQTSRHSLLQRESELEFDLYQGELSLVYFLDDVREGDIVEYSYSLVGAIPYFSSHFTSNAPLQTSLPIERFYRRLVVNPERCIQMKSFCSPVEPQITDLSTGLREWVWEIHDCLPYYSETGQPAWYENFSHVQLSEYRTWKEVIDKLIPIYSLPQDLSVNAPDEMLALVETWQGLTQDPEERAFLAARFVQEKVRYLGFEEGINGYKPADPRVVFQRRFGDCKDKTLLLCALLKMMDIDSTPVLVDIENGRSIVEYLPSPFVFNHVVLRIDFGDQTRWVDSTMHYQGGSSLRENFFPEYHYGLPLSTESFDLIPLPSIYLRNPTEINTQIKVISEDAAEVKILWTFYQDKADHVRNYLASYGLGQLAEDSLKGMQKLYGKATPLFPMKCSDDRENNIIVLEESYRIPIQKRAGAKTLKVYSFVIKNYLESDLNPERSTPYQLYYPAWIKEHVHVESPFSDWIEESENSNHEHECFYFNNSIHIQGQDADFDFELKYLKDHVPLHAIYDYWQIANEIEEGAVKMITLSQNRGKAA